MKFASSFKRSLKVPSGILAEITPGNYVEINAVHFCLDCFMNCCRDSYKGNIIQIFLQEIYYIFFKNSYGKPFKNSVDVSPGNPLELPTWILPQVYVRILAMIPPEVFAGIP